MRNIVLLKLVAAVALSRRAPAASPPSLTVSDNGRYLVTADGQAFFCLGDTAWRFIQTASRTGVDDQPSVPRHFEKRSAQGFNVIQTVLVNVDISANAAGPRRGRLPPRVGRRGTPVPRAKQHLDLAQQALAAAASLPSPLSAAGTRSRRFDDITRRRRLLKDGESLYVKGAVGCNRFAVLRGCGGNAVCARARGATLDGAHGEDLFVMANLPIRGQRSGMD